jgi:hypothetical protein
LVEQRTLNPLVVSSILTRPTTRASPQASLLRVRRIVDPPSPRSSFAVDVLDGDK